MSSGRGPAGRGPWERAQSLADSLRRAGAGGGSQRRRTTQVRVYDDRGLARAVDPDAGPGARMLAAAEAMLREAGA